MKIYVANLDNGMSDEHLKELFAGYGDVSSAEVVKDVFTNMSRGFGYVEMEEAPAMKAINELNQTVLHTLVITVEKAPEKVLHKGSYKSGGNAKEAYLFGKY